MQRLLLSAAVAAFALVATAAEPSPPAAEAMKHGESTPGEKKAEVKPPAEMKPGEEMTPETMAAEKPRGKPQDGDKAMTADTPAKAAAASPAASTAALSPAAEARIDAMAARIDALLAEAWAERGIEPAAPATDTRFLRRVFLDLVGRIPRGTEAREFLRDTSPAARRQLVERLLASREHADYMASVWHAALLPDVGGSTSLEPWLAEKFAGNTGYDQIARSIVLAAAKGGGEANLAQPLDRKPTELAAAVSRTFLGTQIQCAECHKHPTDVWTQDDFQGFAAFFGAVTHPQKKAAVSPRFLGDTAVVDAGRPARPQLADWLASPANPWFAKAAVNRLWGLLFGAGIVHPIDDLGGHNTPAHAGMLDELAGFFAAGQWNHRDVLRVLTRTRAYGLAGGDGRLFASMPFEPLNAVQLYNSLATAYQSPRLAGNVQRFAGQATPVDQFLAKFRTAPGQEREYTAGIPQAITMMNGQLFDPMRAVYNEVMLAAQDDSERVAALFLATVSRPPTPAETQKCLEVLGREQDSAGRRLALLDIHWALVNSAEFAFSP
jgi:hypothetical protein